jgi:meiotically up-regulated gene 157 (Mug157) protein
LLAESIDAAISQFGIVSHPVLGKIFAYEVDGYGSFYFMDDANIPSLLSLPYLGYCKANDPVYCNTRKAVLSRHNPYYSEGTAGAGVGGPHVGAGHLWPMAIMMRAMTSESEAEVIECLSTLKKTHASTGFMHETFWKDDATQFTRPWFAWANTLFGELILHVEDRWPGLLARSW